mmetsp:Transcript_58548/g.171298  ORF Transcript_58548/g.171298 Transcript_58548/m.171298 type:complete len:277 (-) Transcript_58548:257-1087(-)
MGCINCVLGEGNATAKVENIDEPVQAFELRGYAQGDEAVRCKTEVWVSPPFWIPEQAVDLESLDVAAFVNTYTHETKLTICDDEVAPFNMYWRSKIREMAAPGGPHSLELLEYLKLGRSNGYPLRLQILCLPPHEWFNVHAHPNIEVEYTLAGTLHEIRLANHCMPPASLQADPPVSAEELPELSGPDLTALSRDHADKGTPLDWRKESVGRGEWLVNEIGSVHQSFTEGEGCTILVLWSGCHANVKATRCCGVCDLLRPKYDASHGWPRLSRMSS